MSTESRLVAIRKHLRLNQTEFASGMGFSRSIVADIERGQTKVSTKVLEAVMKKYSANVSWLLTGEGEMFLPSEEEKKAKEKPSLDRIVATKEELAEVESLARESSLMIQAKADRAEVERLQKELARLEQRFSDHLDRQEGRREGRTRTYLPRYSGSIAAGPPIDLEAMTENGQWVDDALLPRNRRGLFTASISGQSMGDIIPDGSLVILRVCQEPIEGRVFVFTCNNRVTIKRYCLREGVPVLEYRDGSGDTVAMREGEVWTCTAEYIGLVEE